MKLYKYPRTSHIAGSGLQQGDEDLTIVPFEQIAGRQFVVEEKMDGANSGVSFSPEGRLLLQSRGHFLGGGEREQQFALLKAWVGRYAAELYSLLGNRYVMYGEWLYARHTLFYTDLPHYFLEFDIYDTERNEFLSTARRRVLLRHAPFVASVAVLHEGPLANLAMLRSLIGPSGFIAANHREQLREACLAQGLDAERALRESDPSGLMEGLYIKVEEDGVVRGRYKFIRAGFLQTVLDSGSHWIDRPLLPNRLGAGVSLF